MENIVSENNNFPEEIKGFNFGAFFLSWIWGIGHRVWLALLSLAFQAIGILGSVFGIYLFYTGVQSGHFGAWQGLSAAILTAIASLLSLGGFIFAIYLGFKGNRLVWKKGRYTSVDEFKKREKKWTIAGLVYVAVILVVILPTCLIVFSIYGFKMMEGGMNGIIEAAYKAKVPAIQQTVEKQYSSKDQIYCGGPKQIKCGKYSFQDALTILNKGNTGLFTGECTETITSPNGITSTTTSTKSCSQCKEKGLLGGGSLVIQPKSYTITPYNASCEQPLSGSEVHKER